MKALRAGHFDLKRDAPVALMMLCSGGVGASDKLQNYEELWPTLPLSALFTEGSDEILPILQHMHGIPCLEDVVRRLGQMIESNVVPSKNWFDECKRRIAERRKEADSPYYVAFERWLENAWNILNLPEPNSVHDLWLSEPDRSAIVFSWKRLGKILCNPTACKVFAGLTKVRCAFEKVGLSMMEHDLMSLSLLATEETPFESSLTGLHNELLPALYEQSDAHFGGWMSDTDSFCPPMVELDQPVGFSHFVDRLNERAQLLDNIAYVPLDKPDFVRIDLMDELPCKLRCSGEDESAEYEVVIAVLDGGLIYRKDNEWYTSEDECISPSELKAKFEPKIGGVWLKRKCIDPAVVDGSCLERGDEKRQNSSEEDSGNLKPEPRIYAYDKNTNELVLLDSSENVSKAFSLLQKRIYAEASLTEAEYSELEEAIVSAAEEAPSAYCFWMQWLWSFYLTKGKSDQPAMRREHWDLFRDIYTRPTSNKMLTSLRQLDLLLLPSLMVFLGPNQLLKMHQRMDRCTSLLNWPRLIRHMLDRNQHMSWRGLGRWLIDDDSKPFFKAVVKSSLEKSTVQSLLPDPPPTVTDKAVYLSLKREPGCLGINLRDLGFIFLKLHDESTDTEEIVPYQVRLAVTGETIISCPDGRNWSKWSSEIIDTDQLETEFEPKIDGIWLTRYYDHDESSQPKESEGEASSSS